MMIHLKSATSAVTSNWLFSTELHPEINDILLFYAPQSQEERFGSISGISVGAVTLSVNSQKQQFVRYLNVIEFLSQTDQPFSVPGNFGGLVFDARGRALGTVLGGIAAPSGRPTSYLLLPSELAEHAPATFARFFMYQEKTSVDIKP